MKQSIIKIIVFILITFMPLLAYSETSLEFRTAAFFHSSDRFRDIYGRVGPSYQIEAAHSLNDYFDCYSGLERFNAFANIDWYSENGKSEGLNWKTKVSIANFSFGLRYPYYFTNGLALYVGIGPSISRIVLNNHNHNFNQKRSDTKIAFGGILKTGILYSINCNFFLDVFVDYLYQPVHYSTRVDIGGFKIGSGLGYKF